METPFTDFLPVSAGLKRRYDNEPVVLADSPFISGEDVAFADAAFEFEDQITGDESFESRAYGEELIEESDLELEGDLSMDAYATYEGEEDLDEETAFELLQNEALEHQLDVSVSDIPALISEDTSAPGYTCYLRIDIGKGNYPLDMTGVYVPSCFDPKQPADVVLYLHGMTAVFPGPTARINDYWKITLLPHYDLRIREEVEAAGRNIILVAPSLGKSPNSYANLLIKTSGLDQYLGMVLAGVNRYIMEQRFNSTAIDFRNIILSAHSAGGRLMRLAAMSKNPVYGGRISECWGFDSLYSGAKEWAHWARKNPDRKLYIYYKGSTQAHAHQLKKGTSANGNVYVIPSKAKNHYWVPKFHLKERIQQLATSKPDQEYEYFSYEDTPGSANVYGEAGGGRVRIKKDPLPGDITHIDSFRKIPIHRIAKASWQAMVDAARQAGFKHPLLLPTSGYRSYAEQKVLWEQGLKKHGSAEEAQKWVAKPGGSAHQSGRAFDLHLGPKNSKATVGELRNTGIYKWLVNNASRFGFYPYEREPWHWEHNPLPGHVIAMPAPDSGASSPLVSPSSGYQPSIDIQKSVRLNEKYSKELGWDKYIYEINDLMLQVTGQEGVSLGPEALAEAIAEWQKQNGFTGKDVDGIIGPGSWRKMSGQIKMPTATPETPIAPASGIDKGTVARVQQFETLVKIHAVAAGLNPSIVMGIIAAESGGNEQSGKGHSGYKGLMQAGTTDDHLQADVSIREGIKKFVYFRDKVLYPWLQKIGIDKTSIEEEHSLKMALSCYNAGPVTAMKAIQYAHKSGGWRQWLGAENYKRALLFSGGYAFYASCNKNATDEQVQAGKQARLKYKFKTSNWRNETDPPAWFEVSASLPQVLQCWIGTKHVNTPGYLDKFLRYYKHYEALKVSERELELQWEEEYAMIPDDV